jgi:hypothetical protein
MEDYRLAYFINQKLPVTFEKGSKDIGIQIEGGKPFYPLYF